MESAKPGPRPYVLAVALAFAARVWLIWRFPNNYALDGWQRWAGREHLLVQDWLPGLQAVIWLVAHLGGGVRVTRVALAAVTSLGVGAGAAAAGAIGGRPAAWIFAALAAFGPTLVWTGVLYQEGLYASLLYTGLALALRGGLGLSAVRQRDRPARVLLAADLVFGLLPLVRYEGWAVVFCYLAWRRDASSLRALWGEGVWALVKICGLRGAYPSPVDYFEDWRHIASTFDPHTWLGCLVDLGDLLVRSGGLALLAVGLASAGMCWRARGIPLLTVVLVGQLLATLGWIAGLEGATQRMLVLPAGLAALIASVGAAEVWMRLPRLRALISALLVVWVGLGLWTAAETVDREHARVRPEIMALGRMQACKDCVWWVVPRTGLGAQGRDDGCEALQGMTHMVEGLQFWCEPWHQAEPADAIAVDRAKTNGSVRWSSVDGQNGQYVVQYDAATPSAD